MTTIRLVCATWETAIARQAWSTLITDFQPSCRKRLGALVHPESRILPHVRQLIVCSVPSLSLGDLETALRCFLECMPRGALKRFISMSTLSPSIFKDLIVWHPKLDRLEAFVDPVLDEFKQCGWMLPRLSEIRKYQMWIKRTTEAHTLEVHRILINGLSNMEELNIYYEPRRIYRASHDFYVDVSSVFANSMRFERLSTLSLCGIDMLRCSSLLLERLDISKLRRVHLLDCSYVSTFLEYLSDWYAEHKGALEIFYFRYSSQSFVTTHKASYNPLERFLTICPSLSDIRIESRSNVVLPIHCIIQHRRTLRNLSVGTDSWPYRHTISRLEKSTYTAQDLEVILLLCPRIQTLELDMPFTAVDLGTISSPKDTFELARQAAGEVHVLPEFENMLSIIAQHRNIHTIRMLNLPKIGFQYGTRFHPLIRGFDDTEEDVRGCQRLMQMFADEVFRFLASCNSAVQFLDIKPTLRPAAPAKWDDNGHQWPVYAYRASQTSRNGHIVSWSKPCKLHYSVKALQ